MGNKYIIKNCPAYWNQVYSCTRFTETSCQSCTDCVMKQIYEMCKSQKESSCTFAVAFLADRILQLLKVEECE